MRTIVWYAPGHQKMPVDVTMRHLKCDLSETTRFRGTLCYEMDNMMRVSMISVVNTR